MQLLDMNDPKPAPNKRYAVIAASVRRLGAHVRDDDYETIDAWTDAVLERRAAEWRDMNASAFDREFLNACGVRLLDQTGGCRLLENLSNQHPRSGL